jgi:hypothetical protein
MSFEQFLRYRLMESMLAVGVFLVIVLAGLVSYAILCGADRYFAWKRRRQVGSRP